MNLIKSLAKELLKVFIYFIIISFILTIFYYFGLINTIIFNYLRLISFILIIYFNNSKRTKTLYKNSFISSLLLGIGIVIIFSLIAIGTKYKINFKLILYYVLIILISILGGFKKNKKEK